MVGAARAPEHHVRCLPPVTFQGGRERLPFELDGVQKSVTLNIQGLNRNLVAALPNTALDLLEIAALVYAVDAAVSRGGTTDANLGQAWHRGFHIQMPVRALDVWSLPEVKQALEETLMFLSGDRFVFEFAPHSVEPEESGWFEFKGSDGWQADRVLMFSGGLDSFAGTLEEIIEQRHRVALVSHFSSTKIAPVQRWLRKAIVDRLGPDCSRHVPVRIQLGSGTNREGTHRTRSFLFAALGTVTALAFGRDRVSFHENGVVSLNLPPVANVVGTRATRTTHPQTLHRFTDLFSRIFKCPVRVDNPFFWRTKTEVVQTIDKLGMADQIAATFSCADVHNKTNYTPHCGRCSQCIDRRFATLAARLDAYDPGEAYAVDLMTGKRRTARDREIALSYLRNAAAFEVMRPEDLERHFPAVLSAVQYLDEPPQSALSRILDLLRRHGASVTSVMRRQQEGRSGANWPDGSLPALFGEIGRQHLFLPSVPVPTFAASKQSSKLVLVLDRRRDLMVISHCVTIGKGATFDLLAALADVFLKSAGDGLAPLDYRYVRARSLAEGSGLEEETVRRRVNRARQLLRTRFESAQLEPDLADEVIENSPWHGYRLNPDLLEVRLTTEA